MFRSLGQRVLTFYRWRAVFSPTLGGALKGKESSQEMKVLQAKEEQFLVPQIPHTLRRCLISRVVQSFGLSPLAHAQVLGSLQSLRCGVYASVRLFQCNIILIPLYYAYFFINIQDIL